MSTFTQNGTVPPAAAPVATPAPALPPPGPAITPADLAKKINADHRNLEPFREKKRYAIKEANGAHFGKGDQIGRPINRLAQAQATLVPNLVMESPKHRVRTARAELRGEAELLELALDTLYRDLDMVQVMREVVLDAIFAPLGIVRVGMATGAEQVKYDDWREPRAHPFVARIDFDDYVYDTTARCRREMKYEGHRYRVPKQYAIDSGIFGHSTVPGAANPEEAVAMLTSAAAIHDDPKGEDRGARTSDRWELADLIELWDIAVYDAGQTWLVTVLGNPEGLEPAADGKWLMCEPMNATRQRPYLTLTFVDVPNSPLGRPLAADWMDLHDATVVASNKAMNKIKTGKTNFGFRPEGEDDALTIRDAPDGQFVKMADPEAVKQFEIGGITKEDIEGLNWLGNAWAEASGNLPLQGGQDSAASTGTATAAQYLQANSTTTIRDKQDRVRRFHIQIDTFLGEYLTTDPGIDMPLPYRLEGGESITVNYTAAMRQAGPVDVNFDVEPFAEAGMDPNVRIARVGEFLTQVVNMIPGMQAGLIQPSGMVSLGRQEYGIENLDELIPDVQNMMATQQTYAGVPLPGGPKPQAIVPPGGAMGPGQGPPDGAGGPPQGPTTGMGATRGAMAVPAGGNLMR